MNIGLEPRIENLKSLLILMVTLGRLYLRRRSLPTTKAARGMNRARQTLSVSIEHRLVRRITSIGEASIYVTPQESGKPLCSSLLTIGTIPHSQTGKMMPRSPLTRVATRRFFGSKPVMTREGINAAMIPEINEPRRTKGMPSKISALVAKSSVFGN